MSRFILSAFFCAMAVGQTAYAIAPVQVATRQAAELRALRSMDKNDVRNVAGMKHAAEKKKTCNVARDQGDRDAKREVAEIHAGAAAATQNDGSATAR